MKKIIYLFLILFLLIPLMTPMKTVGKEKVEHDVELWNTLQPLDTTLSFMNTGAHPDDERSHLLAYLSRGLGLRTASLIANRGEGGQNEIGKELGNGLGIIRSNELIEASEVTGIDVFHLSQTTSDPIYDFGFSKSSDETLEKWGSDQTYERFIHRIRTYKPDILFTSFLDVNTQHGHHRAINQLTRKAFEDAADPTVYPEQLEEEGLSTWQAKKLYLPADSKNATTSTEIGMYDPIYGMTYPQLGEKSRYLHKSQGMGNDIPAEPEKINLRLAKSLKDIPEQEDLFDGLAYDFSEIASQLNNELLSEELSHFQKTLEKVIKQYPNRNKAMKKAHIALNEARKLESKLKNSNLEDKIKEDILFRLDVKQQQLSDVSKVAANLKVETVVEDTTLVQNGQTQVTVTLANKGKHPLKEVGTTLNLPEGWTLNEATTLSSLKAGEEKTIEFTINVPSDANYFKPYEEPVIHSEVSYSVGPTEVKHSYDANATVAVLPDVSVQVDPNNLVVNTLDVPEQITVDAEVQNNTNGELDASVSLDVPKGWEVEPEAAPVTFEEEGESKTITFTVSPGSSVNKGEFSINPIVNANGKSLSTDVQKIDYDHIDKSYYLYPAKVEGVAFDLNVPETLKVGYVDSGFDKVTEGLQGIGMDVTKLSQEDLQSADLSQYDTIVTGVRAYLSREDLRNNNGRLLDYVEDGGHLVVQYNKPWDNWNPDETSPYNLVIGQPSIEWRVTNEDAEVDVLKPNHPLFNYPNSITENDWSNWVQERGLYYPMQWDDRFETFVSMADPNEEPFNGGILMADHGEGTYMYTNLVWYRQIQNNVPGGYRIFSNLISYPLYEE
ncbi:NEW3 domain-containing protein [Virgibacillus salinus]|uniref:N-acetylglucosaminyl deacetylase, LmbE family n=1 Tax=Virgibacillus salinus TaxID=553311 RepID=A0A1H0YPR8_9BACI|nr:NEW3 domain-containing protein [Virgibacillus salinus]SDQ17155.1 N-acetylglucosaminyl deacetylase, LmbE family [Virgibacillus salinus]